MSNLSTHSPYGTTGISVIFFFQLIVVVVVGFHCRNVSLWWCRWHLVTTTCGSNWLHVKQYSRNGLSDVDIILIVTLRWSFVFWVWSKKSLKFTCKCSNKFPVSRRIKSEKKKTGWSTQSLVIHFSLCRTTQKKHAFCDQQKNDLNFFIALQWTMLDTYSDFGPLIFLLNSLF